MEGEDGLLWKLERGFAIFTAPEGGGGHFNHKMTTPLPPLHSFILIFSDVQKKHVFVIRHALVERPPSPLFIYDEKVMRGVRSTKS